MTEEIKTALTMLDDDNDAHWTSLGLPSIDALNEIIQGDEKVTRAMVNKVDGKFRRHMADDVAESEVVASESDDEFEPYSDEDLNPVELMDLFVKKMQAEKGKWSRYCQPLHGIMLQYQASEPTIKQTYERARLRGRL